LPWVEDDLFPGVIRVQCGDDALDRIVEQGGANADDMGKLKFVGVGEERLVLANGFALVVEDRPAAADPTWIYVWASLDERPRFGLNFFLNLPSETVGVGEADLQLWRGA